MVKGVLCKNLRELSLFSRRIYEVARDKLARYLPNAAQPDLLNHLNMIVHIYSQTEPGVL